MVSGAATVFIWKLLIAPIGGVLAIYELLPAFIVSAISIVVASLLTKEPEGDVLSDFDKAKSGESIEA
jgi:sodium/proline symporter